MTHLLGNESHRFWTWPGGRVRQRWNSPLAIGSLAVTLVLGVVVGAPPAVADTSQLPPLPPSPVFELVSPTASPVCDDALLVLLVIPGVGSLVPGLGSVNLPPGTLSPVLEVCDAIPVPQGGYQCALDSQAASTLAQLQTSLVGIPAVGALIPPPTPIATAVQQIAHIEKFAGIPPSLQTAPQIAAVIQCSPLSTNQPSPTSTGQPPLSGGDTTPPTSDLPMATGVGVLPGVDTSGTNPGTSPTAMAYGLPQSARPILAPTPREIGSSPGALSSGRLFSTASIDKAKPLATALVLFALLLGLSLWVGAGRTARRRAQSRHSYGNAREMFR